MRTFTVIDKSGLAYMTQTDRNALKLMLATESVRCCTAKKQYWMRGSQKLSEIKEHLESMVADARTLHWDREGAQRMLAKIKSELEAGKIFYELQVVSKTYNWTYYFFA
jgi:hypothetical protein